MFALFKKDPIAKLTKQYNELLSQAMQAQRSGDIRGYSQLTEQAEVVRAKIEALEAKH